MPTELPPGTATYSDRNEPPNNRQILAIAGSFVLGIVAIIGVVNVIANQLVWWIPPQVEKQLGTIAVPIFSAQAKPSPTQDSLNQILDRLETELPPNLKQDRDYQVLYISEKTVNALAIPGDRIIIYQGLLAKMQSQNELVMVIGHELGHFAHRDHLRSLGRGFLLKLVFASLFGDMGSVGSIALSSVETFSQAHYSQSQESEADDFGLDLLVKTYGHAGGATTFFEDLSQEKSQNFDFLATHPTPQKRIDRLKKLIDDRHYPIRDLEPLPPELQVTDR